MIAAHGCRRFCTGSESGRVVIGAGPAGCAAVLRAAALGLEPLVIEPPGAPQIVAGHVLDEAEMGLLRRKLGEAGVEVTSQAAGRMRQRLGAITDRPVHFLEPVGRSGQQVGPHGVERHVYAGCHAFGVSWAIAAAAWSIGSPVK